MPVFIERIEINNFRSCRSTSLPLARFTPLIGYNNSGKSNIISAIQWLLRRSVLDIAAFNDPDLPIEVVGHISGLSANELATLPARQQQQIAQYIVDEKLRIKRTQPGPGVRAADIALSVWDYATESWTPNPTGIDNAIGAILPEPIRIGAMEDAEEDSSKAKSTTTIGKLLAEFIGPVRQAHEAELNQHLDEVDRRISASGDLRLAELGVIDNSINQKINDLFPGIGVKLHFPVPNVGELIKAGTIRVYEGPGEGRGFSSYGHGAQRSIQMALVRHLAEVRRTPGGNNGTTLLLIDEPELYLHPFAIEQIREALKTLSGNGYQVIISTHSAQMVTAEEAHNSLLVRKTDAQGTHARMRMHDAVRVVVPNAEHQIGHLFSLGNASQILFSDKVILAEGKTEQRLVPALVKAVIGRTLGQERTALISQDGGSNTKKSIDILRAMDIPSRAVVDLDYAMTSAITHGFLTGNEPAVTTIRAIFQRLSAAGQVTLNPTTGMPMRGGAVTPAAAFALMAAEPDATQPIEELHQLLLAQNIWLWKIGAIENHLGLAAKNELEWARFQVRLEAVGFQQACADPQGVADMVAWACQ